ncbi:hypothetical protein [Rhizobium leguminosarum]|uniref:hypothetical protein n=1 Tax=Rhizobium leguminosarum TaxID=384 RepID=UPI001C8FED80|nr:hypothetical protein [Rhizobium leguminosarum]
MAALTRPSSFPIQDFVQNVFVQNVLVAEKARYLDMIVVEDRNLDTLSNHCSVMSIVSGRYLPMK